MPGYQLRIPFLGPGCLYSHKKGCLVLIGEAVRNTTDHRCSHGDTPLASKVIIGPFLPDDPSIQAKLAPALLDVEQELDEFGLCGVTHFIRPHEDIKFINNKEERR